MGPQEGLERLTMGLDAEELCTSLLSLLSTCGTTHQLRACSQTTSAQDIWEAKLLLGSCYEHCSQMRLIRTNTLTRMQISILTRLQIASIQYLDLHLLEDFGSSDILTKLELLIVQVILCICSLKTAHQHGHEHIMMSLLLLVFTISLISRMEMQRIKNTICITQLL